MDPMRDADVRTQTGGAEAGDGWTPGIPGLYYKEIVKDILPGVEMKYNTYLTDPSDEGLKATRDHRAFAGYSRGAAVCNLAAAELDRMAERGELGSVKPENTPIADKAEAARPITVSSSELSKC